MADLRITVRNLSELGGTFLSPAFFGFHNGAFDPINEGGTASFGLETLAEDGATASLTGEMRLVDSDSLDLVLQGAAGLIAPQEFTSTIATVDEQVNTHFSFASMVLPSNDAFIGTFYPRRLFSDDGAFLGAQNLVIDGSDVFDAGTEVNTELDAAFLNQLAPNTGLQQGGTIERHPGFNGSDGNPEGEGDRNILGGVNGFDELIDSIAADFTRPGAQVAEVHVNIVSVTIGSDARDVVRGTAADDLVAGGEGRDVLVGNGGFDFIDGGDGADKLYGGAGDDAIIGGADNDKIFGGSGRDTINGGTGRDWIRGDDGDDRITGGADKDYLFGGAGDDVLTGAGARDLIFGGDGDDYLDGGTGNDRFWGGSGADIFALVRGDGKDRIDDFDVTEDRLLFVNGPLSYSAMLQNARDIGGNMRIDYTPGYVSTNNDFVVLVGVNIEDLSVNNFLFA
ncbi:MAG: spondin domain-containing protein [Pseudomonadota bacterium]